MEKNITPEERQALIEQLGQSDYTRTQLALNMQSLQEKLTLSLIADVYTLTQFLDFGKIKKLFCANPIGCIPPSTQKFAWSREEWFGEGEKLQHVYVVTYPGCVPDNAHSIAFRQGFPVFLSGGVVENYISTIDFGTFGVFVRRVNVLNFILKHPGLLEAYCKDTVEK